MNLHICRTSRSTTNVWWMYSLKNRYNCEGTSMYLLKRVFSQRIRHLDDHREFPRNYHLNSEIKSLMYYYDSLLSVVVTIKTHIYVVIYHIYNDIYIYISVIWFSIAYKLITNNYQILFTLVIIWLFTLIYFTPQFYI